MNRRRFLGSVGTSLAGAAALLGCRGQQVGEVLKDNKKDIVGSHAAGAETYKPLIDESLGKLLARQCAVPPSVTTPPAPKRICFVGLENKSSDDTFDYKDQIIETIDTKINTSQAFAQVSRRFTEAGLREARLRPDELFVPANQRKFLAIMEAQGAPFDYLLFATLTSGTTRSNDTTQKDTTLTLELVDIHTGTPDKESASIRKGYSKKRW